jgi:hypothetical protein
LGEEGFTINLSLIAPGGAKKTTAGFHLRSAKICPIKWDHFKRPLSKMKSTRQLVMVILPFCLL